MKQFARLSALAVALSVASAGTAQAATTVACTTTTANATCTAPSFTYAADDAGIFGHVFPILTRANGTGIPGTFTDTFTFETSKFLIGSFRLGSTSGSAATARDRFNFLSVTINGTTIPITTVTTPNTNTRTGSLLDFRLPAGVQTLVVSGTTRQTGSYNGSFALVAVPEPATWGMMIVGFGVVGASMRRRKHRATKPAFA